MSDGALVPKQKDTKGKMQKIDPLAALSLTHIRYDAQDPVGYALAYASLVPILLVVAQVTVVASRRELAAVSFLVGQLACEALNAVLKATWRELRPVHPALGGPVGRGYGMPSSHAQFMGFFGILALAWLTWQLRAAGRAGRARTAAKMLGGALIVALVAAVCVSRVYLGYHTAGQTAAGLCVGCATGAVWYLLTIIILRPHVWPLLLQSHLLRALAVRDSGPVSDIWAAEWALVERANAGKKQ